MNEISNFLKVEIKRTQNRIDARNDVTVYEGVEVGTVKALELNRKHILFCQRILDMIEKEETAEYEHESSN